MDNHQDRIAQPPPNGSSDCREKLLLELLQQKESVRPLLLEEAFLKSCTGLGVAGILAGFCKGPGTWRQGYGDLEVGLRYKGVYRNALPSVAITVGMTSLNYGLDQIARKYDPCGESWYSLPSTKDKPYAATIFTPNHVETLGYGVAATLSGRARIGAVAGSWLFGRAANFLEHNYGVSRIFTGERNRGNAAPSGEPGVRSSAPVNLNVQIDWKMAREQRMLASVFDVANTANTHRKPPG